MSCVSNKITSVKRLSALAQLVALYRQQGITSTAELARLAEYTDRAIRKAKAELECRNQGSANPEPGFRQPGTRVPPRSSRAPARIDNYNYYITTPTKNPSLFGPTSLSLEGGERGEKRDEEGASPCSLVGGHLSLSTEETAAWLPLFGGDSGGLSLALVESAAYVQANSNRPLVVQVRAQLARRARDKRERDARYAAAARERGTEQEVRNREFAALLAGGAA